ncbi:hypothetical protein M8J77_019798 [Diaphorina citri]|nr:hypothetical protein M8J77_019798 [Diaphorina citri]
MPIPHLGAFMETLPAPLAILYNASEEMDPNYLSILKGRDTALEKIYKEKQLHRIFEKNAALSPDNTALIFEEQDKAAALKRSADDMLNQCRRFRSHDTILIFCPLSFPAW